MKSYAKISVREKADACTVFFFFNNVKDWQKVYDIFHAMSKPIVPIDSALMLLVTKEPIEPIRCYL